MSIERSNRNTGQSYRSPDVVRLRPNTRQNGVAALTRDQHETTPCVTPLNLQNLDPRFKSGRHLQFSSSNSIVCAPAVQANAFNWTTVDHKLVACSGRPYGKSLIQKDLIGSELKKGGGSENLRPCAAEATEPGGPQLQLSTF